MPTAAVTLVLTVAPGVVKTCVPSRETAIDVMVSPVPGVAPAETVKGELTVALLAGDEIFTVVDVGGGGVGTVTVMDLVVTVEALSVACTAMV